MGSREGLVAAVVDARTAPINERRAALLDALPANPPPADHNVLGTVVGVFFVAVTVNDLTPSGAASWVERVFDGGALLVAVGIASHLSRRRQPEA